MQKVTRCRWVPRRGDLDRLRGGIDGEDAAEVHEDEVENEVVEKELVVGEEFGESEQVELGEVGEVERGEGEREVEVGVVVLARLALPW